ncbi:MAG: SEC-C domain-containing protein [Candidatus Oceanisphaera merdipullorum]|nr:SEC-C domain-containing protein [Candidatus Oceanisphaera merdipullorum]
MSDKFFFKGRQDARQSHIKYGYETQTKPRNGSKKYPLVLVVTSEARKLEVEALVAEAELYAEIELDTRQGAVESIGELTVQLSKQATVKVEKLPSRNDVCSCGSGKKFKKCCG